jgi:hypothetical protein
MLMRSKMSRESFLALFPKIYKPHKVKIGATKKGYVPILKEKWKPAKSKLSPAQWHREGRKYQTQIKSKRKWIYKCPVCRQPMPKLGWCEIDRKWAVLPQE